jgi:hypothetical protein
MKKIQNAQRIVHDLCADVFEVAIDSLRTSMFQTLKQIAGLVANARVEAVFATCVFALLCPPAMPTTSR